MASIGIKSSFKAQASLAKLGGNSGTSNAGPIKKAIISAKPNDETDSAGKEEDLEKDSTQNEAQETVKKETEHEKEKNLDRLLSRGLAIKKGEKTEKETEAKGASDKDLSKEINKEIDKEWTKNSNAKEDGEKSRFEKAREDGLQDQLKNDKDSIVKNFPGLDRAGAGGSPNSEAKSPSTGSNSNSNDNSNLNNGNNSGGGGSGNSGVSKLSDNSGVSNSHSHNHTHPHNHFNDGGSVIRPDHNHGLQGGGCVHNDFPRDNGNNHVDRPDPGHSDHSNNAFKAFDSLYAAGNIEGKVIQTGSSEDAKRITAGLRDLGVFSNIEQNGNSIKLSQFNSQNIHQLETQKRILGQEFLAGRITNFDFEVNNPNAANALTKMLENKAGALGSTNHSITSNCDEGVCKVSLGQKTENTTQNQQEQQYAQNENNSNRQQDKQNQDNQEQYV